MEHAPDVWCKRNNFNFLVTHHPVSWLEERAQRHFNEEIYDPARFTAHFYGHMHTAQIASNTAGGTPDRRRIQAASLFGLRKIHNSGLERLHGYSAGSASLTDTGGSLTFWPRTSVLVNSGTRRFAPDTSFDLTEENCFSLTLTVAQKKSEEPSWAVESQPELFQPAASEPVATTQPETSSPTYVLPTASHHLPVRRIEQERLRRAISENQKAWIVADWGTGVDEFLWSVVVHDATPAPSVYRLDLGDYRGRQDFLDNISRQTGCSFQQFCKTLAGHEAVTLIFDNVPGAMESLPETLSWEIEVLSIVDAVREYCPNVSIVLISRLPPRTSDVAVIELRPLDEPDLRSYLLAHPAGGAAATTGDSVQEVFRLSDGLPAHIDSILSQLRFMTLSELVESRITSNADEIEPTTVTGGLAQVIDELRRSTDPATLRAFGLLTALTCFPYGETLSRIRRFFPDSPFHPSHVEVLLERGLVEIQPVTTALAPSKAGLEQPRKIVAKKAVRDYVESLLSPSEQHKLYSYAASIYFGDAWANGKPRPIGTSDLVTSLGGEGGLCNPQAIITFLIKHAIQNSEWKRLEHAVTLALIFAANLEDGDYFRSCVTACKDFLLVLNEVSDRFETVQNFLKFYLAKGLRMLGQVDEAKAIFAQLEDAPLDRTTKQRVLLNLAISSINDDVKRRQWAQQIVKLDKDSGAGIHARAILLQMEKDDPNQLKKLAALETLARNKKAFTAANNIAAFCANNAKTTIEEKRKRLVKISLNSQTHGDVYSAAKAALAAAALGASAPGGMSSDELSALVRAYHYLYSERIGGMFKKCHTVLWDYFEKKGDLANLLRMFRHSSFIWRISGKDSLENEYLSRLSLLCKGETALNVLTADQETAYFLARARRLGITLGK